MQLDKKRNPFTNDLQVPYIEMVLKLSEFKSGNEQKTLYKVEQTPRFEVYTSVKMREYLFQNLSMYARDLLTAIQHSTNNKYPYVILSYEKMQTLYGKSIFGKRRYEDTVRELIKESIIEYKDKKKGQFWFNPIYFSPSNRLKLYPECAVKVGTKHVNETTFGDE